jgi:hypothetical protein
MSALGPFDSLLALLCFALGLVVGALLARGGLL